MNVLWLVKRTSKRNFKKGIIYAIMLLITLIISFIFFIERNHRFGKMC